MSNQKSPVAEQFWRQRAAVLATRLNFHHWLARLVPKLFVFFVLLALFDLFRREIGLPSRWGAALLVLGSGIVAGWAWIEARRHFCSGQQALIRLETVLGLNNRLSAAQAGVVPWPAVTGAKIDDGYSANWKQILLPLLAGTLFLWGAHLVPVSKMKLGTSGEPISEPPEFTQVQNWINALKAEDMIEPAKLQDMQSALDKLKERPAQDWYTQSNLEAANTLKELTEQSMNSLSQDLDKADQSVQSMQEKAEAGDDAAGLQAMQEKLNVAAENLASGNLPLKRELVDQMKNGESASDKALSAKQLADLHDRLKKGQLAAQTAPKSGGGFGDEMNQALVDAAGGKMVGRGQGMGNGGMQRGKGKGGPGSGGLGGGETSAPLELQERDKTTPDGPLTSVSNDDMSHVSIGETIKISASKPTVDPATYGGAQTAGAAQVQGSGGEAVWRSTYDPQEADTLSRFFK